MRISSKQNAVFNRTGRIEIPNSYARRRVEPGQIYFDGLHQGEWSNSISPDDLAAAVLYVDVRSLFSLQREQIAEPSRVFEPGWQGCIIGVPSELTGGDYRVKLQLTIALPSGHQDAGRIIAQSSEIVIVEVPNDSEGKGSSLLKVRPSVDDIPDLSRLDITEAEGPVLYVNASIPALSWKELAAEPAFKHGIFSNCVREILRYLVVNPGSRSTWGEAWLDLEGIRGRDLPEIDDSQDFKTVWQDINDFADAACEGFLEQIDLPKRFAAAFARTEGDS